MAAETNISDLLLYLSDLDPAPWQELIGFVPTSVAREVPGLNNADLDLQDDSQHAVIEVKLGHLMSRTQQEAYEALRPEPDLYLAALSSDAHRVSGESRWAFLGLVEIVALWEESSNSLASQLAMELTGVLRGWDSQVSGVFTTEAISSLDQKFLVAVVARRMASALRDRDVIARAGRDSGGMPLVQSWVRVRGGAETTDRCFIAEVRWRDARPGADFRFGVDFDSPRGTTEDAEIRRASFGLASSMEADLTAASLVEFLEESYPLLRPLVAPTRTSRPRGKGDWTAVVDHGFIGAPLPGDRANNRRRTSPPFYGDGALRFEAKVNLDLDVATADGLVNLMEATLQYLHSRQPATDVS